MRWLIATAACLALAVPALGQYKTDEQKAEIIYSKSVLRDRGIGADSASLLKYFTKRTPSKEKQQRLERLVHTVGHEWYRTRARATFELKAAGQQALPFLEKGLGAEDEEVVRRVEVCLDPILMADDSNAPVVIAAARMLAVQKPPGSAKVMLDFLPFVKNQSVIDQIGMALPMVTVTNGRPDSAVVKAAKDSWAVRRALAGAALAATPGQRETAFKMLQDPHPEVRFHVASALVKSEEAAGVPALITLLEELPLNKAWHAEDVLIRLAGEKAPEVSLGHNVTGPQARKVWKEWWNLNQKNSKTLLAQLAKGPQTLGYTLISQLIVGAGTNGVVKEIDRRGNVRWKIEGLRYPVDAKIVGPNRVLVAEYLNSKVTERDFKGKVFWSQSINMPSTCQRLANGNTFIVSRRELLEVDRKGKRVFSKPSNITISAAYKTRTGEIYMVTSGRQCIRMDARGNQIKSFTVGQVYTMAGNIEVLANGRILIPEYSANRVVEYTPDGKVFWEAPIQRPTSVVRLANGNTLAVSMTGQSIVEINRTGRVVWEHRTTGRPWRARRR